MSKWITRKALEAMGAEDRANTLGVLRAGIDARLAHIDEWEPYWREAQVIITELKAAGHDLWSWDADGERSALWGWDYMRLKTAGRLQIQFNVGGGCQTFWRDEDPRLGVDLDGAG